VTIRTYSILASVIGSAVGAWWWNRQRMGRTAGLTPAREHGTVIFDNTPTAADVNPEGIV
jgi:hypothetical protein